MTVSMVGFKAPLEKLTRDNTYYRHVVYTNPKQQLVLMSLEPGEDIELETHRGVSQFIRIEEGNGYALVEDKKRLLKPGDVIIVPPGTPHYIKATGGLKLYTIYSPPQHQQGLKQARKPLND